MAKLFANSGDPDQTSAALIWQCTVCQLPSYGSPVYNGLNKNEPPHGKNQQNPMSHSEESDQPGIRPV